DTGATRGLIEFRREEALRHRLLGPRLERFIGVIYRPDTELQSHYAEASLPQRFNGLVWFDETQRSETFGSRQERPRSGRVKRTKHTCEREPKPWSAQQPIRIINASQAKTFKE